MCNRQSSSGLHSSTLACHLLAFAASADSRRAFQQQSTGFVVADPIRCAINSPTSRAAGCTFDWGIEYSGEAAGGLEPDHVAIQLEPTAEGRSENSDEDFEELLARFAFVAIDDLEGFSSQLQKFPAAAAVAALHIPASHGWWLER